MGCGLAAADLKPVASSFAREPMARTAATPTRKKSSRKERSSLRPTKVAARGGGKKPIDLYYWPTPNGWKVTIMLEECGLPYTMIPVAISKGDQFKPQFLAISPNNRMPAIVDHDGPGGKPISIFESGAILQYLGRKTGKFYPKDERARVDVEQWLFWQMANLGPKSGEANHFRNYAAERLPYAIERFGNEMNRIYGVMNRRLKDRAFLAGNYSIADIACVGWAPSRAPRPRYERLSQRQTLARNFAGASRGQTRSVGQGGSGLSRRHEGSEGARNSVQSEGALSLGTERAAGFKPIHRVPMAQGTRATSPRPPRRSTVPTGLATAETVRAQHAMPFGAPATSACDRCSGARVTREKPAGRTGVEVFGISP